MDIRPERYQVAATKDYLSHHGLQALFEFLSATLIRHRPQQPYNFLQGAFKEFLPKLQGGISPSKILFKGTPEYEYLDNHGLRKFFEESMAVCLKNQPQDPFDAIFKHIADKAAEETEMLPEIVPEAAAAAPKEMMMSAPPSARAAPAAPGAPAVEEPPPVVHSLSGSYHDRAGTIDLRVDVDPITKNASVLNVVSGDLFSKEKKYLRSFIVRRPTVSEVGNTTVISGAMDFLGAEGVEDSSIDITIRNGSPSPDKVVFVAQVVITEGEEETHKFRCARYSLKFRRIQLEVDTTYTLDGSLPPKFSTHECETRPADLEDSEVDVFSVLADAGIDMTLDRYACNIVNDQVGSPWDAAELMEAMDEQALVPDGPEGEDHDQGNWRVWAFVTREYADTRQAGVMFDRRKRRGFGFFRDHPWFRAAKDPARPRAAAIARRAMLHIFVHEIGHVLNLPHSWEGEGSSATSLSFMNYPWRYNQVAGPDEFYRRFRYQFTPAELMHLRHGALPAVRPGSSAFGNTHGPSNSLSLPNDPTDEERLRQKVALDLRCKATFAQMEPVVVELRLRNLSKKRQMLDLRLHPEDGNVAVYVTRPDGTVAAAEPIVHSLAQENAAELLPLGAGKGLDRASELVSLVYSDNAGFYFQEPGKYIVKAVYESGPFRLVSEAAEVEVVAAGLQVGEFLAGFFVPNVGEFLALGGSPAMRFEKARKVVSQVVAAAAEEDTWQAPLAALAAGGVGRPFRQLVPGGTDNSLRATPGAADSETALELSAKAIAVFEATGGKSENLLYRKAVLDRAAMLHLQGKTEEGDELVKGMVAKLEARGVSAPAREDTERRWARLKGAEAAEAKKGPQELVADVFASQADDLDEDDDDAAAGGDPAMGGAPLVKLRDSFSDFDSSHRAAAYEVVELLWAKSAETESAEEVLKTARYLVAAGRFNADMVKYAVDVWTMHHPLSKELHLQLHDEVVLYEGDFETAAIAPPDRSNPQESDVWWWQNDSDMHYHHRQWHAVYGGGGLPGKNGFGKRHIDRQGEIFIYMHVQMLARYNADRVAAGLEPVVGYGLVPPSSWQPADPWRPDFLEVEPLGCDLSRHRFHDIESRYPARPAMQRWPERTAARYAALFDQFRVAVRDGELVTATGGRTPIDQRRSGGSSYNLLGHALESTSAAFQDTYGSLHNSGHGVFRGVMLTARHSSRDPVFYRWHTLIDHVAEQWGNRLETELLSDPTDPPPKVALNASDGDVIMSLDPDAPAGFGDFASGDWAVKGYRSDDLYTVLAPPRYQYEDGKLTHDEFTWHLRLKRAPGAHTRDMPLTVRIYMAPADRADNRRSWIEMDKFRYVLRSGEDSAVVSRRDYSAVVVRKIENAPSSRRDLREIEAKQKEAARADPEKVTGSATSGFCDCGWPYTLLLPKGTEDGMRFKVFVMVTDNTRDGLDMKTKCGSLSYCGSRGDKYPDKRDMGYPFTTNITVNGRRVDVTDVPSLLPNVTIGDVTIKNVDTRWGKSAPPPPGQRRVAQPAPQPAVVPTPVPAPTTAVAAGASSGMVFRAQDALVGSAAWANSGWKGAFRILLPAAATSGDSTGLKLVLQGRPDGAPYVLKKVSLAKRKPGTLDVEPGTIVKVTFGGGHWEDGVTVPSGGAVSDAVAFNFTSGADYFATFAAEEPGCFYRGGSANTAALALYTTDAGAADVTGSWGQVAVAQTRPYLYFVAGLLADKPPTTASSSADADAEARQKAAAAAAAAAALTAPTEVFSTAAMVPATTLAWRNSTWVGTFRVLMKGGVITGGGKEITVRLKGRTSGVYAIEGVRIMARAGYLGAEPGTVAQLTFNGGSTRATVSTAGATSDPLAYNLAAGVDYFLQFYASSPTVFLKDSELPTDAEGYSWVLRNVDQSGLLDWGDMGSVNNVYALDAVTVTGRTPGPAAAVPTAPAPPVGTPSPSFETAWSMKGQFKLGRWRNSSIAGAACRVALSVPAGSPGGSVARLVLRGRTDGSSYMVRSVTLARRAEGSAPDAEGDLVPVTFGGATSVSVGEAGATSDPVPFEVEAGAEYLVTFALDTPSVYTAGGPSTTAAWFREAAAVDEPAWDGKEFRASYPYMYVVDQLDVS